MRQSPPPSPRWSRATWCLAFLVSPQCGTSFPHSQRPPQVRSHAALSRQQGFSSLYSTVDIPMRPMEDEKEKRSERITDEEDQKEWKRVVGGFVPRFLRREGADVRTSPVEMVDTLEDYKRVVVDEPDRIVVVRFFAPWCKSCKAAHPIFKKMVSEHSETSVKFVEVPLTKETAYIHEGLGVPSVPFGHIYHPEAGLVEEKKINKRVFKEFREALDSYVRGSCDLPLDEGQEEVVMTQGGFL